MKLFKKEVTGDKTKTTILGFIKLASYKKEVPENIKTLASTNKLVKQLLKEGSRKDFHSTIYLINKFSTHWDKINNLLYKKLSNKDKKTFILFLLKRHGGINVISKNEAKKLHSLYLKVYNLMKNRKNTQEPMKVKFRNHRVKYATPKTCDFDVNNKNKLLQNCYEIVHAFWLNEYYLKNFAPKKGQVILDCGAAFGDTAIAFSKQFDAEVHSFESDSEIFNALNKNVEVNNLPKIQTTQTFLYSKTGQYEICGNIENTLAIDDYVKEKNLTNIGMIKFDIEGGEQEALKGAINTIKTQKPILAIPIYHLDSDLYEIPKFLDDLNMDMKITIKWLERLVNGVDCCVFVKFK